MDIKEETEIALKDAYWAEVRKLFDVYLHAVTMANDQEPQMEAAAERFKKGLALAQAALMRCRQLVQEPPKP
jgi:hypothetical protein